MEEFKYKLYDLLDFLGGDLRITAIVVALIGAGIGLFASTGVCTIITIVLAVICIYWIFSTYGTSGTSGDLGAFLMCFLGSLALCVPMWLTKLLMH